MSIPCNDYIQKNITYAVVLNITDGFGDNSSQRADRVRLMEEIVMDNIKEHNLFPKMFVNLTANIVCIITGLDGNFYHRGGRDWCRRTSCHRKSPLFLLCLTMGRHLRDGRTWCSMMELRRRSGGCGGWRYAPKCEKGIGGMSIRLVFRRGEKLDV